MTTRLLFSKLLLIFSHKILIFLKKNLGGPNLLLDPQFYSEGSMDPLDPPVADPMDLYTLINKFSEVYSESENLSLLY